METSRLPAATAWLAAVVNDGQLMCTEPAPGWPLARYTVPCTVVVVIPCAAASRPTATLSGPRTSHLAARSKALLVFLIGVPSFFPAALGVAGVFVVVVGPQLVFGQVERGAFNGLGFK